MPGIVNSCECCFVISDQSTHVLVFMCVLCLCGGVRELNGEVTLKNDATFRRWQWRNIFPLLPAWDKWLAVIALAFVHVSVWRDFLTLIDEHKGWNFLKTPFKAAWTEFQLKTWRFYSFNALLYFHGWAVMRQSFKVRLQHTCMCLRLTLSLKRPFHNEC